MSGTNVEQPQTEQALQPPTAEAGQTPATLVPAVSEPSLLGAEPPKEVPVTIEMPASFEGGDGAWAKLDDVAKSAAVTKAAEDKALADKANAEAAARIDAFDKADGKEAKLAAYNALAPDEKAKAFAGMSDEQRKELGVEDPAIPVYTEFKLPDGFTLDEKAMGEATALFKEARLPQEQAQKFIDFAAIRERAIATAPLDAYVKLQNGWVSDIKTDPDVGGDKFEASIALSGRAIDRLGGQPLRDAMNLTGAGNNPAIFKAFVRLGQMISEDRFRPSPPAAPQVPRSAADVIYDGAPKGSSAET